MLGLGTLSSTLLYFPTNLESTLLQTTLFLFLVWDSETKPWVLLVFIPLLGWRCFWASRPTFAPWDVVLWDGCPVP